MVKLLLFMVLVCSISVSATTYYISPSGNDTSGNGTIGSPWFTLNKAWTVVAAGDTIYLRGGTYEFLTRQTLTGKSGTSTDTIKVYAHPNETPNLTKSVSFTTPSWPIALVYIEGNYLHFKGIEVSGFTQATATIWYGIAVRNANNNVFERINSHNNGHGMVIRDGCTNNLVLNSDFHHNYDPLTSITYGDADGLEVGYLAETTENTIKGCRFYYNSDDGLDLWYNNGNLIIENSMAFKNGYREDGTTAGGDGNGFKLGQTDGDFSTYFKRYVANCVSFMNRLNGFDENGAMVKSVLYNNTAYSNINHGFRFSYPGVNNANILKNNASFDNGVASFFGTNTYMTITNNTYDPVYQPTGVVVSSADFTSVDTTGVSSVRQDDGSLPTINFLRLVSTSDLIDTGTNVGIPYNGIAPDIGAYEWQPLPLYKPIMKNGKYLRSSTGKIILTR